MLQNLEREGYPTSVNYLVREVRLEKPHENLWGKMVQEGEVDLVIPEDMGLEILSGTRIAGQFRANSIDPAGGVGSGAHKPIRVTEDCATYRIAVAKDWED